MIDLDELVRAALAQDGISSAAIFVVARGDGPGAGAGPELRLAAAAGIAGPPLDGLIAAVGNAQHPIRLALGDAGPTWDVEPMNPGGPVLRSHLPLRSPDASTDTAAMGVLALAHDAPLSSGARQRLAQLAGQAAAAATPKPQEETR